MHLNDCLTVAAYQGPIEEGKTEENLNKSYELMCMAEQQNIDILCFPESYLHGYFQEKNLALTYSIDLQSTEFAKTCETFSNFRRLTTLN